VHEHEFEARKPCAWSCIQHHCTLPAGALVAKLSCIPDSGETAEDVSISMAAAAAHAAALVTAGCAVPGVASSNAQGLADALTAGFSDSADCNCDSADTVIQFTAQATIEQGLAMAKDMSSDIQTDGAAAEEKLASEMDFAQLVQDTSTFADEHCEKNYGVKDQSAETCIIDTAGNETVLAFAAGMPPEHSLSKRFTSASSMPLNPFA
jgi:hypothetical protein